MELKISKKASAISPSPTLAIDSKFKEMKKEGIPVVGFGAGEPDFNTPENIKNAGIEAIKNNITKYTPASGTLELKAAVCQKLKRDTGLEYSTSNIVISNGGKHSLTNTFTCICDPGDEVILPAPYWVSYPEMIKLADAVPVIIEGAEENNFKFTAEQLESAITSKTRALVLNTPSNPTGMVYTKDELEKIAEIAVKNNIYIIFDEIYEKLVYEGEHTNIATLGDEIRDLTIIVNGLAKTYAMTGWRIGFVAANKKLAKAMGNIQSHATSNPNSIAQAAAVEALNGDQSIIETMKKTYIERRDYMVDKINSIDGLSCKTPHGAFYVFMNVKDVLNKEHYGKMINTANELCQDILDRALVALVPSEGFGVDGYVRLSYATSMDTIKTGLDRIEKYLKGEFNEVEYSDNELNA
ncbi:MAG: pyridoxal phosphate-dependent aminotransferase [Eubacteriales bacterium]|jgi:aspartate aminotransferase|nr:pyridoxal phosphate-dependent aminotransferase [Eubacteriales bacterium]MDY4214234.1 pyridoxal phosphate-dependent aminotransferase [Eubacteriales bacterium]MDY5230906.1 pyridoxal phosphate-dependent aminotransferase [Eubacteriales bacterium]